MILVSPPFKAASLLLLELPLSLPVNRLKLIPAFSAKGNNVSKCCRANISVGAIIAPWPPASTAAIKPINATIVLPDPTSP